MKRILAIGLAFTASCSESGRPVLTVEGLLQDAQAHNEHEVRVCGILSDNIEYCGLVPDVPKFNGEIDSRGRKLYEVGQGIWVNAGHDICMPGKKDPMSGSSAQSWAIVKGKFQTGGKYGHLDTARHQIVVSEIQLLQKSCRAK